MAEKSNVLEIIQGIQQAAANAFDGALGNMLTIKYQGEVTLREVYKGDYEGEIEQRLQDIANFLKKEYKKITGNGLTLTKPKDSEPHMIVQTTSKVRSWVQAQQEYKIGGIPDDPELGHTVEERLDDSIKNWLGLGKDKFPKTKNPENVSGKRDEEPKKKLNEAEELELGKEKVSSSSAATSQRADLSAASELNKGISDQERGLIQNVIKVLRKYAQQGNLAAGSELTLLKKVIVPLQKKLKQGSSKN